MSALIKNTGAASTAYIVTVVTSFLSIPVYLSFLSIPQFGIWMAIQTLVTYLNLAQFGTSTAVTTLVANNPEADPEHAWKHGAWLLFISTLLCLLALYFVAQFDGIMHLIFKLVPMDPGYADASTAAIIMLGVAALKLPANSTFAILVGIQKQPLERFYNGILIPVSILAAALFASLYEPSLTTLAVATSCALIVVPLIATAHCYALLSKVVQKTNYLDNSPVSSKNIFDSGRYYFVAGLSATIGWNADVLLISSILGAEVVAEYSVIFRVVAAALAVTGLINSSIYPILARLWGLKRRTSFERLQTVNIISVSFISSIAACGIIFFGGAASSILSHGYIETDHWGVFFFGVFVVLSSHNSIITNSLLSTNTVKTYSFVSAMEALLKIVLGYGLIKWAGLIGAPASSCIVTLIVMYILFAQLKKRRDVVSKRHIALLSRQMILGLFLVSVAQMVSSSIQIFEAAAYFFLIALTYIFVCWASLRLGFGKTVFQDLLGVVKNPT